MTIDTAPVLDEISAAPTIKPSQRRVSKSSAANDPAQGAAKALEMIDKLQEQNHKAGNALDSMATVWLNATAARRRAKAIIALSHFDGALDTLRKALEAAPK